MTAEMVATALALMEMVMEETVLATAGKGLTVEAMGEAMGEAGEARTATSGMAAAAAMALVKVATVLVGGVAAMTTALVEEAALATVVTVATAMGPLVTVLETAKDTAARVIGLVAMEVTVTARRAMGAVVAGAAVGMAVTWMVEVELAWAVMALVTLAAVVRAAMLLVMSVGCSAMVKDLDRTALSEFPTMGKGTGKFCTRHSSASLSCSTIRCDR